MKEFKFTRRIEFAVSHSDLKDIITTAFTGGINYWGWSLAHASHFEFGVRNLPHGFKREDECWDGHLADIILAGGHTMIMDSAVEGEKHGWLTLNKIKNAFCIAPVRIVESLLDGSYDVCDADVLIQYAMFKKEVFF